ncbi:MAG: IS3 family transposase [Kiritimatiellae bacterium]|nr:IS3 family transposase [Kiritimatiellia bacterium]
MKAEEVKGKIYPSAQTARAQIFAYIETFYNTSRIHTSLDGLSPCQYEEQSFTLENEDTTTALVNLTN